MQENFPHAPLFNVQWTWVAHKERRIYRDFIRGNNMLKTNIKKPDQEGRGAIKNKKKGSPKTEKTCPCVAAFQVRRQ